MQRFALPILGVALFAAPVVGQQVEYGSIAVIPFTSAVQSAEAEESARVMSGSVEQGLRESGRFMAVLERSAAVDAAIQAELEQATSGDSFDSAIRINTESQMNAKYLVSGTIERHEVTQREGTDFYDAVVDLRLRIVDVETRAVIVNELVEITNQLLNNQAGGGGIGGFLRRQVSTAAGSMDTSPLDAVNKVRENAADEVRQMLVDHVSLLLVDYDVDGNDQVSELVLLKAPDLDDDEELIVRFNRPNRLGGGFRLEDVGRAKVTRTDTDYAYAQITEGHDAITEAMNDDPFRLVVLPEND